MKLQSRSMNPEIFPWISKDEFILRKTITLLVEKIYTSIRYTCQSSSKYALPSLHCNYIISTFSQVSPSFQSRMMEIFFYRARLFFCLVSSQDTRTYDTKRFPPFFVILRSNIKSQGGIVYEIEQLKNMVPGHDPGTLSSGSSASLCG